MGLKKKEIPVLSANKTVGKLKIKIYVSRSIYAIYCTISHSKHSIAARARLLISIGRVVSFD